MTTIPSGFHSLIFGKEIHINLVLTWNQHNPEVDEVISQIRIKRDAFLEQGGCTCREALPSERVRGTLLQLGNACWEFRKLRMLHVGVHKIPVRLGVV